MDLGQASEGLSAGFLEEKGLCAAMSSFGWRHNSEILVLMMMSDIVMSVINNFSRFTYFRGMIHYVG